MERQQEQERPSKVGKVVGKKSTDFTFSRFILYAARRATWDGELDNSVHGAFITIITREIMKIRWNINHLRIGCAELDWLPQMILTPPPIKLPPQGPGDSKNFTEECTTTAAASPKIVRIFNKTP